MFGGLLQSLPHWWPRHDMSTLSQLGISHGRLTLSAENRSKTQNLYCLASPLVRASYFWSGGHDGTELLQKSERTLGSGLLQFVFQDPVWREKCIIRLWMHRWAKKSLRQLRMLFSHFGLQFLVSVRIAIFKDMQQIKLQRKFVEAKVVLDQSWEHSWNAHCKDAEWMNLERNSKRTPFFEVNAVCVIVLLCSSHFNTEILFFISPFFLLTKKKDIITFSILKRVVGHCQANLNVLKMVPFLCRIALETNPNLSLPQYYSLIRAVTSLISIFARAANVFYRTYGK